MIRNRQIHSMTSAVATALMLLACGGDNPETLLASARDFLAKDDAKAAVIQIKNVLSQAPNSSEARFLLGKALLATGDVRGAEVELRKALEAKYAADEVVPLLAKTLASSGQGKKLISEFQKVELTAPEARAELQTTLAAAYAADGQIDLARKSIDAVLALRPDYAQAVMVKARLALAERDVSGALGLVDSVVAKDAKNAEALKLKGDILGLQGNPEASLVAYRQAVEAKPDFVAAHAAIVGTELRQNKLDEAGKQVDAMKKAAPKNPQTLLVDAEYLYQKKDFKAALDAVQEVLKFAPQHPRALLLAGAAHFQMDSLVQAEDFLSRALKQTPSTLSARRMLAVIYLRGSQPLKALELIEPILADIESDGALLSLAGEIYMQTGNAQKAEEYFSKAAALDPQNALKQTKVAMTHFASGKAESAFDELERIASADTGTTADMALIASAIKRKDFAKAMKAIDGLEKKQPDSPLAHALRGTVLVVKGDVVAGRKSLEKALAIKPSYFAAAAALARLDLQDSKPEEAKKRFESILAADGKSVPALLALAELKAKSGGSVDEVAAEVRRAVQASPGEAAPRLALIRVYLGANDAKKALAAAQDAVAAQPDRVEILDALASAQQAAGENNQALATYGKLASLTPTSVRPLLRMAEINLASKDKEAAVQNLRRALELKHDLLAAQRGLIMLYLDMNNLPEAEKVVREVKRQRPKESVGFVFEGDLAASRKAWPEALAAYRAGLKLAPSTELSTKVYGTLHASGNAVEAEKFASSWLADHIQDSGFRLVLAERATALKEYSAAVKHYQFLLQSQPNNPMLLNNLGWTLGKLKDSRALEYAEKALKLAPKQAAILETVASLLAEKGDTARALELLKQAGELAPASNELKLSTAQVNIKAGNKAEARRILDELTKLGDKFGGQAEVGKLLKEIGN